jgi:soluble P-type ATPase
MGTKSKLFQQTFYILKKADIKVVLALSGDKVLVKKLAEKLGMKIKQVDIDAKFFIIDRREILFYLSKTKDDEEIAIWLNSDFFAQAFAALFDKAMGGK